MVPPPRKPVGAQVAPQRCPILRRWQFKYITFFLDLIIT